MLINIFNPRIYVYIPFRQLQLIVTLVGTSGLETKQLITENKQKMEHVITQGRRVERHRCKLRAGCHYNQQWMTALLECRLKCIISYYLYFQRIVFT